MDYSEPELKAQLRYCDYTLSIRLLLLNFHIFDFFSESIKWNLTEPDRKQVCVLRLIGKPRWPP